MNLTNLIIIIHIYLISIANSCGENNRKQPHIVLILADDLGWNDVSYHGANQIPTPNIDALAYNGVILNRFYTLPSCSPSRTALLTGQYPIRLGFQGMPIKPGENRYLPLDVELLPEKLRHLGYTTQLIGKWHLGSAYKKVTPINRGFDYHFGYWHGCIGYFDYEARARNGMHGLDLRENLEPLWSIKNEYVTKLLTEKAKEVIDKHNESVPLFLMMSHLAPHIGRNGVKPEVPDVAENNRIFSYIQDENRRLYAGMVHELDKSVGNIMQALSNKGILNDTLILFLSDNGAQTVGYYENYGSNWPLRGMKLTVLEGGVRNIAILYSAKLKNKSTINNDLFHIADLMPTIYAAAGGNVDELGDIDGINQWPTLTSTQKSKRTNLLVNIDEILNSSAFIGENGRYKLINGSTTHDKTHDNYFGDDGRGSVNPAYDITAVLQSITNTVIGGSLTEDKILQLRRDNDLGNCKHSRTKNSSCDSNNLCLFDIVDDPCETRNLAEGLPEIVTKLSRGLLEYWGQLQPQKNSIEDPKANPIYYNNSWYTWLDDE